jgi:hypothetical protein
VQNDAQYLNDSVNPVKIMNDETSLENYERWNLARNIVSNIISSIKFSFYLRMQPFEDNSKGLKTLRSFNF